MSLPKVRGGDINKRRDREICGNRDAIYQHKNGIIKQDQVETNGYGID